jgi:hypothetical protein
VRSITFLFITKCTLVEKFWDKLSQIGVNRVDRHRNATSRVPARSARPRAPRPRPATSASGPTHASLRPGSLRGSLKFPPATWSSFTRLHPCDRQVVPCVRAGRGSLPYHCEIPQFLNFEASWSPPITGHREARAPSRSSSPSRSAVRKEAATGDTPCPLVPSANPAP